MKTLFHWSLAVLRPIFKCIVRVAMIRRAVGPSSRLRGRRNTHCINVLEAPLLFGLPTTIGCKLAEILGWEYVDARTNEGRLRTKQLILLGHARQVVISWPASEWTDSGFDGLTVAVADVCDLNEPDPVKCLQRLMLVLAPPDVRVGNRLVARKGGRVGDWVDDWASDRTNELRCRQTSRSFATERLK